MDQLDETVNLFESIFNSTEHRCPVCKELMPEDEDDWIDGLRIRNSFYNIRTYGEMVVLHPFNVVKVDKLICAERVSRSWETEQAKPKIRALVESIREDNQRFVTAIINAQRLLYSPKKKSKKK